MENRFGVKDFFLFTLVAVLICVVGLSMWEFDRQWSDVQKIQNTQTDQSKELAGISRQTNSKRSEDLLKTIQKQMDQQADKLADMQKQSAADSAQIVSLKSQSTELAAQSAQLAAIRKQLDEGLKVAPGTMAAGSNNGGNTLPPGANNLAPTPNLPPAVATNSGAPATATTAPVVAVAPTTAPIIATAQTPDPTTTTNTGPDDPFARMKAAQAMPGYAQGDWLVDSIAGTDKITPLVSGDVYAANVQGHVLETLVRRDPVTLEYVPLLARPGWKVIDNVPAYQAYRTAQYAAGVSPEDFLKDQNRPIPITVIFRLRSGVIFSDGEPMTVDDIVWTFNWAMNKSVDAARARSALSRIRRVVKTGVDEVTFDFDQPYFDAVGMAGGIQVMPAHFYSQFSPEDFNKSTGLLLGSGPYKMEDPQKWAPGQQLTLIRNERYWGEGSGFDRLVYRIIKADLPRLTAFTNGELDDFAAQPEQYKSLLNNPDILGRTRHFVYDTPTAGYRFIAWNQMLNNKPTRFADKRVRQAMTMLTDRQGICDEIMLGLASPATGPFNRLGKQNDPNVKAWPYDVNRAKALLKDAGYTDNGSGQLVGPDGQPFVFKFTYPQGNDTYDRSVLYLKDAYARAGITLEADKLDWTVFSEKLKSHNFEAISLGWSAGIESDIYQMFDSKNIKDRGDDFMSYANPKLDALIEQARETVDDKKRLEIWHQCHAIIHEDQPYTFLFTRKTTEFLSNRIQNIQQIPLGLNDSDEWFVPVDQQKWHQ